MSSKAVTLAGVAVLAVTDTGACLYDLPRSSAGATAGGHALSGPTASWRQPLVPRASDCVPWPTGKGASKGCPHQHSDCSCGPDPVPREGAQPELGLVRGYEELLLLASGPGVVACLEVCAPSGKAIFVKERCRHLLPPSKQRWHTCSAFLPQVTSWCVGTAGAPCCSTPPDQSCSRIFRVVSKVGRVPQRPEQAVVRGALRLAEWGPVSTLPSLHGKQGVTSVTCHGGYVYTTGRDRFPTTSSLCEAGSSSQC